MVADRCGLAANAKAMSTSARDSDAAAAAGEAAVAAVSKSAARRWAVDHDLVSRPTARGSPSRPWTWATVAESHDSRAEVVAHHVAVAASGPGTVEVGEPHAYHVHEVVGSAPA